jgi:hypothetical protein
MEKSIQDICLGIFILLLSLVIWRLTHNALAVGVSHARKTQGEVRSGDQTMPLAFSDEEKDLLLTLAAPIDQRQREQFLVEVAAELEAASAQTGVGPGLGVLHRVGRVVQRKYFDPPELPNSSPRFRNAG